MIELKKGEARLCYKTLVGEVNAELDADIIVTFKQKQA